MDQINFKDMEKGMMIKPDGTHHYTNGVHVAFTGFCKGEFYFTSYDSCEKTWSDKYGEAMRYIEDLI